MKMNNTSYYRSMYLLLLIVALSGCASEPSSRYSISQDRAPAEDFDVSDLKDAVPRYEPPRRAGNKSPYTVWGEKYTVLKDPGDYVARGTASWYGEKFHGHKTSNGETFDMYAMSAAHKSLPIPCYARVKNLDNGREVIVRVNDRGPFHGDRLIDLSYAAAKKLGYQARGTARVEVAVITVSPDGRDSVAGDNKVKSPPAPPQGKDKLFVQVAAFSKAGSAEQLSRQLQGVTGSPVRVWTAGNVHRVQVGPFVHRKVAEKQRLLIENNGFGKPIVVSDPVR